MRSLPDLGNWIFIIIIIVNIINISLVKRDQFNFLTVTSAVLIGLASNWQVHSHINWGIRRYDYVILKICSANTRILVWILMCSSRRFAFMVYIPLFTLHSIKEILCSTLNQIKWERDRDTLYNFLIGLYWGRFILISDLSELHDFWSQRVWAY